MRPYNPNPAPTVRQKEPVKTKTPAPAVPRVWKCPDCGETFPKESALSNHMTARHPKKVKKEEILICGKDNCGEGYVKRDGHTCKKKMKKKKQ